MNTSTAAARLTAAALTARGLEHVVISPGSRSAPLTYAFAELAAAGAVTAHVRVDERDAGFFALGLAKGARQRAVRQAAEAQPPATPAPVAVVVTSGTAVANLLPAVLEASYAEVPLVILSADRPARLRGTGANQTLDAQQHVLADVRLRCDVPVPTAPGGTLSAAFADELTAAAEAALAAAVGAGTLPAPFALDAGLRGAGRPGPVQFNMQFDGELTPVPADLPWRTPAPSRPRFEHRPALRRDFPDVLAALTEPGTAVLAGTDFDYGANRLEALIEAFGVPVFAEPSSPLFSRSIPGHPAVLTELAHTGQAPTTVIRTGKITQYRQDQRLLGHARVLEVQADLDWVDAGEYAAALADAGLSACTAALHPGGSEAPHPGAEPTAGPQHRRWWEAGCAAAQARERSTAGQPAGRAVEALRALVHGVHTGEPVHVFAASSNTGRYLSALTDPTPGAPAAQRVRVSASRGLAGIDGLISTAAGTACGAGELVRLVIGDVAALHDVGGLLCEARAQLPRLQIFILNDDGGAIFAGLEHGQEHLREHFARFFAARHGRDFALLAQAYGWPYAKLERAVDIERAAAAGNPGVYEIPLS